MQYLIDWVNSFNDPYCLLVNSLVDLNDGKHNNLPMISYIGVALCHLVGFISCTPSDQTKLRQLIFYEHNGSEELVMQNMDLALNVLKSSGIPIPD